LPLGADTRAARGGSLARPRRMLAPSLPRRSGRTTLAAGAVLAHEPAVSGERLLWPGRGESSPTRERRRACLLFTAGDGGSTPQGRSRLLPARRNVLSRAVRPRPRGEADRAQL